MKNSLEIQAIAHNRVQTVIVTSDGVTSTEMHREGLYDTQVLRLIKEKKYYQHFAGEWTLTIPREHKVFKDPDFTRVVNMALEYMYDRDDPDGHDYFC